MAKCFAGHDHAEYTYTIIVECWTLFKAGKGIPQHLTFFLISVQLSLQELRDAVVKIYENRKNLAATLTDTKNVVANLERVMTAVVQFVLFFAYLAIWKVA